MNAKPWLRAAGAAALWLGSPLGVAAQQPLPPADLAKKLGCMTCHGMVRKQVGPAFVEIAARYRSDPEAPARLAATIRNGSVGAWGRIIMPRQPQVSEADAQRLARWVLAQPERP